jgi:hypothetical protein
MAKSKFTQEEVNAVMEARGINRKSALKFLNKGCEDSQHEASGTGEGLQVRRRT